MDFAKGGPRRGEHFFDEETAYAAAEALAIDRITIAQQVSGCRVPRKGLCNLLCGPLGCRVLGDIEVNHLASSVRKYDKNVQDFKRALR